MRLLACLSAALLAHSAFAAQYFVYAGSYTRTEGKGIYAFRFDDTTGGVETMGLVAEAKHPSFLAVHPNGRFLYAAGEHESGTPESGTLAAYAVNTRTGALTLLNRVLSGGIGPNHIAVDKTGKFALYTNYRGASVGVAPILADGRLGETPFLARLSGSSVNLPRQSSPLPHQVAISPDNRFVFAPALGLDRIAQYRLDLAGGTLTPNDPPFLAIEPGSEPRHMAFQPQAKFAYLNTEHASSVIALGYDARRGTLAGIDSYSTIPADFKGANTTGESEVDARGRFLYVSNRGHDSIAVFEIGEDGRLKLVEHVAAQGKTPRHFKIAPGGRFLFVGNQDSGTVVQFRVDPGNGRLTPAGKTIAIPEVACLVFVRASR